MSLKEIYTRFGCFKRFKDLERIVLNFYHSSKKTKGEIPKNEGKM